MKVGWMLVLVASALVVLVRPAVTLAQDIDDPFLVAVIKNDLTTVREMLAARPTLVNQTDTHGDTALFFATDQGLVDMTKLLIEKGAKLERDKKAKFGICPLTNALMKGHIEIALLLISKGANVQAKHNSGMTPLHWAAVMKDTSVAEVLLSKGARVNARDENGMTPLHFAAANGYIESVKLLLSKGANVNAKVEGKTPLDMAIEEGHVKTADVLRRHGQRSKK